MIKLYCVKRHTEDYTWLDVATISGLKETAKEKADMVDKEIPKWAKDNRQVDVVPVSLEELDES